MGVRYYLLVIILGGLFSCTQNNKIRDATSQHERWEKTKAFSSKLPIQAPDSCLKMMLDSAKTEEELHWMCTNVMYAALDAVSSDKFFQHIENFEAVLGKKNELLHARLMLFKGRKYWAIGKKDSALQITQNALDLSKAMNDTALITEAYLCVAQGYMSTQNFIASQENTLSGLKYIRHKAEGLDLLSNLIYCHYRQKQYQKAKELAFQHLNTCAELKDTAKMAVMYRRIAYCYAYLKQKDSALWAAQNAYQLLGEVTDAKHSYLCLGEAWKVNENYAKAMDYFQKLFVIADSLGDKEHICAAFIGLGNCYMYQNQLSKARFYYEKAMPIAHQLAKADTKHRIKDSLVVLQLKEANDIYALSQFRGARRLSDSLFSLQYQKVAEEMNVKYKTEEKQSKIQQLEEEKKTFRRNTLIAIIVLLFSLYVAFLHSYIHRKKNALLEKEKELLESKQHLQAEEIKRQEVEIEKHIQQLDGFVANLFAKNKLIKEMETAMQKMTQSATCISPEIYAENQLVLENMKILTEDDWQKYLLYFEKANPTLIEKIKDKFSFTQSELRLFLLIKQGLNRDEISHSLGISAESARKSFYRLRKKLDIEDDKTLVDFIEGFA